VTYPDIHSLSNKYNLRTSSLMLLPLISSSISIPMPSCFLCLSVHILQTAENKNRKKLLSCLIHVINYIIILHARNYCDIWYINNWHINFNHSSKYSIWTTVMCKYGFKCHVSFCVHLSGKYGIWTTVICPRVYMSHAFLCTFTVKRIECFSWTRGSQEPDSLNW